MAIYKDKDTLGGVAGAWRENGNKLSVFAYIAANVAVGTPLFLQYDGDEETNPKGTVPATDTAIGQFIIFPTELSTTAGFQWCQVRGDAEVLCDGTNDIAKDDFLEVINAGVALILDGTSRTDHSVAIAQEAYTTNAAGLVNVYLFGERCQIEAA